MNPVTDEKLNEVIQRIVRAVQPEKIILFGSRARGTTDPDADLDLVVVHTGPESKREIQLEIHRALNRSGLSLDVFIMTPEELETHKRIANTLAREVSETGVVCYG